MPVTLIVEDGSIVADANTYISREGATAYLEIDPHLGPVWSAMTDEQKDQMLAFGTRWLDENYQWYGHKVERTQPLDWPRCHMHDGEYPVASTIIPEQVRHATAQAAVWLFQSNPTEEADAVGIKRFRNDTIEIEWQDGFSQRTVPQWMSRLLRVFGIGPGDRGFKPIVRVN